MSRLTLNGDMGDAGDPPRRTPDEVESLLKDIIDNVLSDQPLGPSNPNAGQPTASVEEILASITGDAPLGPVYGFEALQNVEDELAKSIHAAAVAGIDLEDIINQVTGNIELLGDAILENTPNQIDDLFDNAGVFDDNEEEDDRDNLQTTNDLLRSTSPIVRSANQATSAIVGSVTSSQGSSSPVAAASSVSSAVTTSTGALLGLVVGEKAGSMIASVLMSPFTITIGILESIDSNIAALSDELVGFSSEVTSASVDRELALLNDTIRRSDTIGEEVADLIRLQTQYQLSSRRAFDALFLGIEPYLKQILTTMQRAPEALLAGIAGILMTSQNSLLQAIGSNITSHLITIAANTGKDEGFDDDDMMALLDPQQFGRKLPQKPMPQVVP